MTSVDFEHKDAILHLAQAIANTKLAPAAAPERWTTLRRCLRATASGDIDYDAALAQHWKRGAIPVRSEPGRRIDLYADTIARHLELGTPAAIFRKDGKWHSASFLEMHEASGRLATLWVRSGVGPGVRVAIIAPPGPVLWVAMLTCLRLGATAVVFPPDVGQGYISRRLAANPPDAMAVDLSCWTQVDVESFAAHGPTLPAFASPGVVSGRGRGSFGYASDDVVAEVHGGYAPEPGTAVGLTARAAWVRLATDAKLTFSILPGVSFAACGLEPSRHALLFLTALFGGGTWVQASVGDLESDPIRLDIVGVGVSCRDAVIDGRLRPVGWRRWFKDPSEVYDWSSWRSFESVLKATTSGSVGQNILYSSTLCGAALFSPPMPTVDLDVLPTPGIDWVLEEPSAPGQVTEARAGVLAVRDSVYTSEAIGRAVLSDLGVAYLFSGSLLGGSNATAVPAEELSALLRTHPLVDEAAVFCGPSGVMLNAVTTTFVVFVDPARNPDPVASVLDEALRQMVLRDMGEVYLPDRIVAVPLTPRRHDGVVDIEWCRFQLQTGGLKKMVQSDIYRLTSLLRRWGAERANEASKSEDAMGAVN